MPHGIDLLTNFVRTAPYDQARNITFSFTAIVDLRRACLKVKGPVTFERWLEKARFAFSTLSETQRSVLGDLLAELDEAPLPTLFPSIVNKWQQKLTFLSGWGLFPEELPAARFDPEGSTAIRNLIQKRFGLDSQQAQTKTIRLLVMAETCRIALAESSRLQANDLKKIQDIQKYAKKAYASYRKLSRPAKHRLNFYPLDRSVLRPPKKLLVALEELTLIALTLERIFPNLPKPSRGRPPGFVLPATKFLCEAWSDLFGQPFCKTTITLSESRPTDFEILHAVLSLIGHNVSLDDIVISCKKHSEVPYRVHDLHNSVRILWAFLGKD